MNGRSGEKNMDRKKVSLTREVSLGLCFLGGVLIGYGNPLGWIVVGIALPTAIWMGSKLSKGGNGH